MAKPLVILFAKAPRLGAVKRRLASEIGAVTALRLYRNMLGGTLRRLQGLSGCELVLAATPDRVRWRYPPRWRVLGQGPGDLGARMARVFRRFPRRPVVLVGADIPDLAAADIRAALRALRNGDAVFGPAADGGYYLVAMGAKRPAAPFAGVRWSSCHALADTEKNFAGFGIRHLRVLRDIDTAADLFL